MVGGPRSGKTQRLVELAVEWIMAGCDPSRLVLVVRSPESASLLRRRVDAELPAAHPVVRIETHERLASYVLAMVGPGGDRPDLLSNAGEWLAMREALHRAAPLPRLGPLVDEPSCINDALAVTSAFKRALVGPGLLAERLQDASVSLAELAVVAASYQRVLTEMESLDRRDSQSLAVEALLADFSALVGWADLLLVDEAEDLSPAQWVLVRELGGRLTPPGRLVMAGHWTESTPGFRGVSSQSSSRPFEEYFPNELAARDWELASAVPRWTEEWASSFGLDLAAGSATSAPIEPESLAEAAFRVGPVARVWVAPDEIEEAVAVAREIARARLQDELEFSEVAILVRAQGGQVTPLLAALTRLGVPFRSPAGGSPAGNPAVAVAINWLRVLAAPSDDDALLAALAAGPNSIPPGAIRSLRRSAGRRNVSAARRFWELARGAQDNPGPAGDRDFEPGAWEQLLAAGQPWLALSPGDPGAVRHRVGGPELRAILGRLELASGLAKLALSDPAVAAGLTELEGFAQSVAEVERRLGRGAATLAEWLTQLTRALDHAGAEAEPQVRAERSEVALMTMRQAKGQTWPRVFICGCVAGKIPAPAESGGLLDAGEIEELVQRMPELEDVVSAGDRQQDAEARLFLVALTRATGEVTCTWARSYQGHSVERSPFLGALARAGVTEVAAPHAELVQTDDLVTEVALAAPVSGITSAAGELVRAALELRHALAPWDPVAEGAAVIGRPVSISATSVATWLACPRQYLAHILVTGREADVNLTLGTQAHRLLELLYRQRDAWSGDQGLFGDLARTLIRDRLAPDVRADHSDPLTSLYVQLWLERMVDRWSVRIVGPGSTQVGEPIAEEVAFDLLREDWHLRGKVDALWRHPDGAVELLDYKTARVPLSERALRDEVFGKPPDGPQQWQLPIYQLAARQGAFAEQLADRLPTRVRNWYVGADPRRRELNPIAATGFRIVDDNEEQGGPGILTGGELDRIEQEIDRLAQTILEGRFPAQPRHTKRTCLDGRSGCPVAYWCDGAGSVGRDFPTANPEL